MAIITIRLGGPRHLHLADNARYPSYVPWRRRRKAHFARNVWEIGIGRYWARMWWGYPR